MRDNKIKSFHIIGSKDLGGAENFFVRMVEALNDAGHEAIAISRSNGPVEKLFSPRVKQLNLPLASKWDYYSRWKLTRLIKEHQPAIVQSYMSRATRLTRLPVGSTSVHIARLGGYYTIPGNYTHADAWMAITRDLVEYLVKEGLPGERIYHIGNFVPTPRQVSSEELTKLRADLQLPPNAFVIFALGRMIEKKGFQDLIQAFSMLPEAHNNRPLILLLVGDGTERSRYEALAQQLNVSSRIRFAGWQTDTAPYYKLGTIFVVPSRHEPLGNIFLEGWMHGLPTLSTLNEGAKELVKPGKNAFIVPICDSASMAGGLRKMLSLSTEGQKKLIEGGYETVKIHSEEEVVKSYTALYGKLVEMKRTGTL